MEAEKFTEFPIKKRDLKGKPAQQKIARDDLRLLAAAWTTVDSGGEYTFEGKRVNLQQIEQSGANVLHSLIDADAIELHPENWKKTVRPFFEKIIEIVEGRGIDVPIADGQKVALVSTAPGLFGAGAPFSVPGLEDLAFDYLKPKGDTVLIPDFVSVVGSAAESADPHDVDVLIRSDVEAGQYSIQAEGAELAIRKTINPNKDLQLHFLAHPQGPHQGTALSMADLVLRWHEPEARNIKAFEFDKINLGCGDNPLEGYLNIDRQQKDGVDLVWDIRAGLPFPDDSLDEVRATHMLEDLSGEERIPAFEEIHRVLRPEGIFAFEVPHRESAGADMPFHMSHWSPETFQAFASPKLVEAYDLPEFKILDLSVVEDGDVKNIRGKMTPVKVASKASVSPITKLRILPKPAVKFYTELFSPDELWEKWGKDRVPFMAELKYNGIRGIVQKKGDRVSIYFEDSQRERANVLPGLVDELKKVNADFILDANIGVEQDGKPWARVKLATLTGDKPDIPEGAKVVATAFDVIYWDEYVGDQPFVDRRKILTSKVKQAGIPISEGGVVRNLSELKAAFNKYGKAPGSEGLVTKTLDAPYPLRSAATNDWSKIKKDVEVKAIVLEAKTTASGQHNFRGGLLVGHSDFPNTTEFEGKDYIDLGFSYNAPFSAKAGDIVTFHVEEIILQDNGDLAWLGAKPVDVDKERSEPYAANQVVGLARRGGILQDATKEAKVSLTEFSPDTPGGPRARAASSFWDRNWQCMFPTSGKGKFVFHHHWRGLDEEESKQDEKALLETDHSVHGDLRLTDSQGQLWGYTVFTGKAEDVRAANGCRLCSLPYDDKLQGSFKLEEPIQWLTIAHRKPYVADPGETGATTEGYAKFFEVDSGTYDIGVWKEHFFEIFLHGDKLKGRYIIQGVPTGRTRRTWLIARSEDQTPFADSEDLQAQIQDQKKKRRDWIIWAKPGTKPVLYNVRTEEAQSPPEPKGPGLVKEVGMSQKATLNGIEGTAEIENDLRRGFDKLFMPSIDRAVNPTYTPTPWMVDSFPDANAIICEYAGSYFMVPYSDEDGEYQFADRSEWKEVEKLEQWVVKVKELKANAEKAGRRIRTDKVSVLQEIKDKIEELVKGLAEVIGWAEYDDQKPWVPFKTKDVVGFKTFKATDGRDYLLTWTTNAFKDRDGEIFSTKSIDEFIERHKDEEVKGQFWFWHIPGSKFGDITFQARSGRFLVEAGPFDDTLVGQAFKGLFDEYPTRHPTVAPEGWGTSHGYFFGLRDRTKGGVYEWFEKYETSVLPAAVAANPYNPTQEVFTVDKKAFDTLTGLIGEDAAKAVVEIGESKTKELEELGIDYKEAGSKAKASFATQIRGLLGDVEDKDVKSQLEDLIKKVEAFEAKAGPDEQYQPPDEKKPKSKEWADKAGDLGKLGKTLQLLAGKAGGDVGKKLQSIAEAMLKAAEGDGEQYGYPKPKKDQKDFEEQFDQFRTEVTDAIKALGTVVGSLARSQKEMQSTFKKTMDQAVKETLSETPRLSLKDIAMKSVLGSNETLVGEDDDLTGPKETTPQATPERMGAIPVLGGLKAANEAWAKTHRQTVG